MSSDWGENDWFAAYGQSTMPDYSDFRSYLKLRNSEIIGNGHHKEDFIIQCTFNDRLCSYLGFQTTQDTLFGNCFTFNSVANSAAKPLQTTKTGSSSGLKLSLFLDKDEYLGILGQSSGARVAISNCRERPSLASDATYLSAGTSTMLSISQHFIQRRRQPFSNCTDSWPESLKLSDLVKGFQYTQSFCQELCQQTKIVQVCNCSTMPDFQFSSDDVIRSNSELLCDPWSQSQQKCVDDITQEFSVGNLTCDCHQPCQERHLNFMTSTTEWPTEAYAPYFANLLKRSTSKTVRDFVQFAVAEAAATNYTSKLAETLRKNFARVEISFKTLNFQIVREVPKYNLDVVFGTIGGNVGLWLGWSVMVAFECLQFLSISLKVMLSHSARRNF